MFKRLSFIDLVKSIKTKIENNTKIKCYDEVPENAQSPFYFIEVVSSRPANTKTMWCDIFQVFIHAVSQPCNSSVPLYNLIQKLEEALTEDIELPQEFNLILQSNNGIQTIKTDETNEKHGVMSYEFKICYGFRIK